MTTKEVMAQGGIEKLGLPDSFLKFTLADGSKKIIEKNMPEHTVGVELILEVLTNAEYGCIKSLEEIEAVGHRLVHGGEKFNTSVVITPEVIKQGSRYGIKLKAVAPSIHMIRVDVESTFEPIIGTELQSKQLIDYLMKE